MNYKRILIRAKECLLRRVPAAQFDAKGTWVHWPAAQSLRARLSDKSVGWPPKTERRRVLRLAQEILALGLGLRGTRRWTNEGYCPDAPWGQYHWLYSVEMIQELLWCHREFVAGFRFALSDRDVGRDGNPESEPSRERSWDQGYIFGLARVYHPERLAAWVSEKETQVNP